MDKGFVDYDEPVVVTADDPYNTGPLAEVEDYTSVPPLVTNPALPDRLAPAKTVNDAAENGKSDGRINRQAGRAEYSMEAPIFAEDVIRAGGLGARDELGHVLPSAMDATDFEASLRDAQQYEDVEPESGVPRPGVGFVKDQQEKMDGFREV